MPTIAEELRASVVTAYDSIDEQRMSHDEINRILEPAEAAIEYRAVEITEDDHGATTYYYEDGSVLLLSDESDGYEVW